MNFIGILVEKNGILKSSVIKDYKEDELYKKCGFKKQDGFVKQTEWVVKFNGDKITVFLYGKIDGRANTENKYDFPPPVDNVLLFGTVLLVAKKNKKEFIDLTLEMWEKIYEKLFGGFEDLSKTVLEDDDEEDELEKIPKEKKTKNGYLKDGFVVDSEEDDDQEYDDDDEEEEEDEKNSGSDDEEDVEEVIVLEDIGSELSEEEYNYSDSE
jgi:hypothetical protein